MLKKILILILSLHFLFNYSFSQDDFSDESSEATAQVFTLTGVVLDASTGKAVAGANVVVDDSDLGAAADEDGKFSIEGVQSGSGVTASAIGYDDLTLYADQNELNFELSASAVQMTELEVLASRASEKTAVAYTDVTKDEIALRLGSQDIPLAMNLVPSVYATNQGGGAGDARINVRGFNQRNVAVMINGIPVNDMENGWVFWSNWDGVADVTSSIQMQKGLSAQNLATPSIGGSMNIVTDAAALERGGSFKQEVGAWGFLKSTISYNTGLLMDDKLALSGALVRKTGEGYYTGTWTDAWAYFLGATYNLNEKHRFQFYALGAPQRHGQNLYRLNIASLDRKFAESLDDYDADISEIPECGRDCSGTGSSVSDEAAALIWRSTMANVH